MIHLRFGEDPLDPIRVGLVVGRAVGPAVTRNLVKRRLRHLVRDRLKLLPGGATLVVRALPAAATSGSAALAADLDQALRRALRPGSGRDAKPVRRDRRHRRGGPGAVENGGVTREEAP